MFNDLAAAALAAAAFLGGVVTPVVEGSQDTASVAVRRGGEEKTVEVTFFRMPKKKPH